MQIHKPKIGLSVGLISGVEILVREDSKMKTEKEKKFKLIIFRTCMVISHVLSLRGNERLTLELS